jgi:antitoxin VapB
MEETYQLTLVGWLTAAQAEAAPECTERPAFTIDSSEPNGYSVDYSLHVMKLFAEMALNIRNPETERLAEALARETGETKTEAVTKALRDRLARLRRERGGRRLADELEAIARHCEALPVLDGRSADEILGYDRHGLPAADGD